MVRDLAEGRRAATGTDARRVTAVGWLHTASVETTQGIRTPIAVFADTILAEEALSRLRR